MAKCRCGRPLEGRRKYCSDSCKQAAYRDRKDRLPVIQSRSWTRDEVSEFMRTMLNHSTVKEAHTELVERYGDHAPAYGTLCGYRKDRQFAELLRERNELRIAEIQEQRLRLIQGGGIVSEKALALANEQIDGKQVDGANAYKTISVGNAVNADKFILTDGGATARVEYRSAAEALNELSSKGWGIVEEED